MMLDRQRVQPLLELGWSYRRIERETGVEAYHYRLTTPLIHAGTGHYRFIVLGASPELLGEAQPEPRS